jgi:hypothetical protein
MAALVATAIATLTAFACAGAAAAEAPRWVLNEVPSPTHIEAETPRNEVQKLTVDASGGTFVLGVDAVGQSLEFTAPILYGASAADVKSAIAKLGGVGSNGVSVTGGPVTSATSEFTVTFEGNQQGYVPVPVMQVNSSGLEGGTASATEVTHGVRIPEVVVTATNVGGAATNGGTITIGNVLPSWLTATRVVGIDAFKLLLGGSKGGIGLGELSCETPPVVKCTYDKQVDPGDQLTVFIETSAGATPPPGAVDHAQVSGGGAAEATLETKLEPSSAPEPFGPAPGSVFAALSTSQAGAHPNLVTSFWLSTRERFKTGGTKDIRFDLPPGFVGSTVGLPRCTMENVIREVTTGEEECARDTMVGSAQVLINPNGGGDLEEISVPVYNIAPAPGEPAAFAFDAFLFPVRLDTTVLGNGDDAVRVTAPDLPEEREAVGSVVTIWGVPADHDGPGSDGLTPPLNWGIPNSGQSRVPLLTNPQQCSEPLVSTMSADPWNKPGAFGYEEASMGTLTGCQEVSFGSSFSFLPDTLEAGVPAGYHFELNVPQQNTAGTLATSSVKTVSLKLPVGVVVNPSAAWGLKACSNTQFYGPNHPSQEPAGPAECPREAKVGEVEVETPDLEHALKGDVFLGTPECDPCTPADAAEGKMVRLFIQLVGEGEAGIIVKLEGHGIIDQDTGQITTVFKDTPQLPFNRMRFVLEGGPRAVLANPRKCGPLKTEGDLTPWTTDAGVADSMPFYEFEIDQNCFGPQFNPTLKAGSPNIQAGEYSPFTLSFGRSDEDQFLGGIGLTMPPGLLGNIGSVVQCKEPQASQGTCGTDSLIGHVQVLTGPGADPYLVSGGQVFLTGGYEGAPYGLSIVVPAVAGPYTLSGTTGQGTVVVRAKIQVDPIDAHLTVTSDPLPSMLDGIPLQLKVVNVTIDKPGFTFNPTNCAKMAITANVSSAEGMSAGVSSPFQVTNCSKLVFKPQFKVSTAGKTSRKDGASLDVKLTYPKASVGGQANIREVKVDLPKQLPSRLTTLQKACTAQTFEANPASCPANSRVGTASASTPIIPVALSGPAYFVSYGGAKFPELVIVLSGYGVTVQLHGETFISKAGITSSTFRTVPDVPIGSFELKLPEGPFSALAANGDLCTSKLKMPTAFTAQNGSVIRQSTPVSATGCPKHRGAKHKVKKSTKKK